MRNNANRGRAFFLAFLSLVILAVYVGFLYKLQIIEGEAYYNRSRENIVNKETITAARGDILDRYGRVLVSNKESYNLTIDTTKLFAESSEVANSTILELIDLVTSFGDSYIDDLPITDEPPFEFRDMTDIERNMLDAYIKDKSDEGLSADSSAVDIMSYMRTRYDIPNDFSAEDMRKVCGVRYSINVRYAINTADYVFVQDASMGLISTIMEQKLPGINVDRAYARVYNTEYAAHLLGYVGLMTQEEYEKYSLLDYSTDAMVGKDGVEYAFENYLHGQDGKARITTTSSGVVLSTVYEKDPVPGNHVYLTIDMTLQEAAERALDNGMRELIATREQERAEQLGMGFDYVEKWEITGGAAVAVDVNTGEPLAIASWPTYDVSTIIEDYEKLMVADNTPLFNRALLGAYAPGSTFKPCTAIAALTEKIIDTDTKVKCEGVFTRYSAEGYSPECWIWSTYKMYHGEEDTEAAVRDSCNYYFYTISNELGVDKMGDYAHRFGLGSATGIELTETLGNMSNRENHMDYAGQVWRIGDTLQAGIGQSDSIFSPMQIAQYCATVANEGTRYSCSLLKYVRNYDYSEKLYERTPEILSTIQTPKYNWEAVKQGMWDVANDPMGTAYETFYDFVYRIAAKTGTAQKGENIANDAIFICYAPAANPEIAVAVIVERGGSGSAVAFIARDILETYFNIRDNRDNSEEYMTLLR